MFGIYITVHALHLFTARSIRTKQKNRTKRYSPQLFRNSLKLISLLIIFFFLQTKYTQLISNTRTQSHNSGVMYANEIHVKNVMYYAYVDIFLIPFQLIVCFFRKNKIYENNERGIEFARCCCIRYWCGMLLLFYSFCWCLFSLIAQIFKELGSKEYTRWLW